MKRISMLLILAIGLYGCSTSWQHPTASQAQFHSDSLSCQDRANQAIPRAIVPLQQPAPTYNPSYSTTCINMGAGMINCQTNSNAPAHNPQIAQANQAIGQGNADLGRAIGLSSYYDSCMQSKGYSKSSSSNSAATGKSVYSQQDAETSCTSATVKNSPAFYECVERLVKTSQSK